MSPMFPRALTRVLAVALVMTLSGVSGPAPAQAQDKQHVVSLNELSKASPRLRKRGRLMRRRYANCLFRSPGRRR